MQPNTSKKIFLPAPAGREVGLAMEGGGALTTEVTGGAGGGAPLTMASR